MPDNFYYFACPLCQQDVDILQTDSYRVLPLDLERIAMFHEKPVLSEGISVRCGLLRNGGSYISCMELYPAQEYMNKAWVLHLRCISLVDNVPPQQLHRLLELVEPTFTSHSIPPSSQNGAFYAQHTSQEDVSRASGVVSTLSVLGSKERQTKRATLPAEVWDLILQYDIGRLLFVMKTTSQLAKLVDIQPIAPCPRFAVDVLRLTGPTILIHLTTIGGRSYISNLTNPVHDRAVNADTDIRCFSLCGCKYLAVKSDGIGVVDIAFAKQDGQPKWVLGNPTYPFARELSEIKDTDYQGLRIIRDSLKFRAIIPSNRGPEPYFFQAPFPPDNCWVNSSLSLQVLKLTQLGDPFIYFAKAIYIPFANLKRIGFNMDSHSGYGMQDIYVNEDRRIPETHQVTFTHPPTELRIIVCRAEFFRLSEFVLIQFNVDGKWVPSLSLGIFVRIIKTILVKNVVGIWMGRTFFPFIPAHIGTVVSQPPQVDSS